MDIIFLNGTLLKAEDARISVDERGFRFGDGVFETVPLHKGVPYLLEYHLERMQAGALALQIPCDCSHLTASVSEVIAANHATEGLIRIYLSRGIGSQGYLPAYPAPEPTLLIQCLPLPASPKQPVSLWLSSFEKISPRALPTHYKLAQGINATLARMEAREHGCYDAVQLNAAGFISEASSANLFWIKGGVLYTPSLSTGALAGVTRRRLMECSDNTVVEGAFPLSDLQSAQGVFLTNASHGIIHVNSLFPLNYTWEDAALCNQLSLKRTQDIEDYIARSPII